MALNLWQFLRGLKIKPTDTSTIDSAGEMEVLESDGKLYYHNDSTKSPMVTEDHAATLVNKTVDADNNTISNLENDNIKVGAAIDAEKIHDGTVSNTEFGYLNGVTSSIQDQLDTSSGDLSDHIAASSGVHGVSGSVVGTTDSQTLTNKTISNPIIDGTMQTANGAGTDNLVIKTGDSSTTDASGNLTITTGDGATNGTSGSITIESGTVLGGSSTRGGITIATGDGSSGTSGSITFNTSATTPGDFTFISIAGANRGRVSMTGTKSLALPTRASDPTGTLAEGEMYYNTTTDTIKIYDGTNWHESGYKVGNLSLDTNTITTTTGDLNLAAVSGSKVVVATAGNSNIELTPNGTGVVDIDNISLSDNTITTQSGDLNLAALSGSKVVIATAGNANIELTPNGTGVVDIDNISISDNTITTQSGNLTLDATTNYINLDTTSVKLPVGTSDPSGNAEGDVYYNTTSDKLRVYSGSSWGDLSGGGAGTKNYIGTLVTSNGSNAGNPNFEGNTVSPWVLGNSTLDSTTKFPNGTPTFGSGASGNLSISAVSSGQLAGAYSLSYASSTSTTAGNFVASDAFYIDQEDYAKVLQFKFAYKLVTDPGVANRNFSGTSSNSFGVAIYDVTTGGTAWIQPAGVFNITQSSGVGYCTGTFQTTAASTQYRIVIYNANATTGAITMYFDDFSVGPQITAAGPAMSDFQAVTLTPSAGFGSISNASYFIAYSGDRAFIRGRFTATTPAASTLSIPLPSGVRIDGNKLASRCLGTWKAITSSGVSTDFPTVLPIFYDGSDTANIYFTNTGVSGGYQKRNGSSIVTSGDTLDFEIEFPVAGKSSNTVMSNDTDTRVVAMSTSSITGTPQATATQVVWNGMTFDTHASLNTSTGGFTAPVTGYYQVSSAIRMGGTIDSTDAFNISIRVDGVSKLSFFEHPVGDFSEGISISGIVQANAGQVISIYFDYDGTITSPTFGTSYFCLNRLSGPATIAATETVAIKYQNTAGTNLTSSITTIPFATKIYDTHNAFNTSTNTFTVPVSGKYTITAQLRTGNVTNTTSQLVELGFLVTSTPESLSAVFQSADSRWGAGVSRHEAPSGTKTYSFNAGDIIAVQASSNNTIALSATAGHNTICIERVGN